MGYYDSDSWSTVETSNDNIGEGLSILPIFKEGKTQTLSGMEKLCQNVYAILKTPIGSRFFRPTYGSNIHKYIFQQDDNILEDIIRNEIVTSVNRCEPRAKVDNVEVDTTSEIGVAKIKILISKKSSNIQATINYVLDRKTSAIQ